MFVLLEPKRSERSFINVKKGGKIFSKRDLKAHSCYSLQWIPMVLLRSKDILCESPNAIHFHHLRCVLCTHRHHIVPPGAANRFVWPGSLFCLSFSSSPHSCLRILCHPPPLSQNLILKKDYRKTTWVISCHPENYTPVEKTPKPLSSTPTFPLSIFQ